jgi:hypothetical protein
VELDGKVTGVGDKPFSLSFSRCALPRVTGEKKAREEAGMATGRRGCGGLRAAGEVCSRTMGAGAGGARDDGTRDCHVSKKDQEKVYGGMHTGDSGWEDFFYRYETPRRI